MQELNNPQYYQNSKYYPQATLLNEFYLSLYTKVSQTLRKLEDTCLLIFRPIVEYIGKFRTASEFMNFLNILARNAEWFRRDIRNISVQQQRRINLRPENLLRK